jgi:3-oxoacyl-[acyl-carrier protein] reductase
MKTREGKFAVVGGNPSTDVEGRKIKVGVNPDLLAMMGRSMPLGRGGLSI